MQIPAYVEEYKELLKKEDKLEVGQEGENVKE